MLYSNFKYLILVAIIFFCKSALSEEDKYASVRATLQTCFTCHGENGKPILGVYPILAGQQFYYLYVQLKDFKSNLRDNKVMSPLLSNIEKSDLRLMAEYFSEQKWPGTKYKVNAQKKAAALRVIDAGQCVACHLGGFEGNSRVPRLGNQHVEYLTKTMLDFKNRVRNNARPMNALFATFEDDEISSVAEYLAGIK